MLSSDTNKKLFVAGQDIVYMTVSAVGRMITLNYMQCCVASWKYECRREASFN